MILGVNKIFFNKIWAKLSTIKTTGKIFLKVVNLTGSIFRTLTVRLAAECGVYTLSLLILVLIF